MPISPFGVIRTLAIVVAAAAVLVGCATPAGLSPAASPDPEPSPSASPRPLPAPGFVLDVGCADVLSAGGLEAALGEPVSLQDVVTRHRPAGLRGPVDFGLRQLGGLECEWSNGEPGTLASPDDPNPAYLGGSLMVLPAAEAAWAHFAMYYGDLVSKQDGFNCYDAGPYGVPDPVLSTCTVDRLVGDCWIALDFQHVAGTTVDDARLAAGRLFDEAASSITAAEPSTVTWSPPVGTIPLARPDTPFSDKRCDQFFSPAEVQTVLGLTELPWLDSSDASGGDSLLTATERQAGNWSCVWSSDLERPNIGSDTWLPGGEWAWTETLERAEEGTYASVPMAGLEDGDRAYLDCPSGASGCTLDLIVGHNWIRLRLFADNGSTVPMPAALTELGTLTVAAVRSDA